MVCKWNININQYNQQGETTAKNYYQDTECTTEFSYILNTQSKDTFDVNNLNLRNNYKSSEILVLLWLFLEIKVKLIIIYMESYKM